MPHICEARSHVWKGDGLMAEEISMSCLALGTYLVVLARHLMQVRERFGHQYVVTSPTIEAQHSHPGLGNAPARHTGSNTKWVFVVECVHNDRIPHIVQRYAPRCCFHDRRCILSLLVASQFSPSGSLPSRNESRLGALSSRSTAVKSLYVRVWTPPVPCTTKDPLPSIGNVPNCF